MEKSKEDLERELALLRHIEEERRHNDARYSFKIVERIVFGMVTMILLAVLAAIIGQIITK